ncbi:hypothetical protein [Nostoc sp. 'Peltigera malacea cyanobiont' DB3992]|uniref:hypothetical protein n=1 Tax=Nostoc sp. 'Peltigera malacea cyanobiont' DB3992 TaxID=1206980 RepID=UPI000C0504FC|nr:hypothetical protein [Nostoc sp. 'Peltigera malacea cyanobiont' DB3992]PHM06435.1 hypothetical protein CK516_33545 [Nostoc sp. 'Peltigera malacea cyanobiont' DB3992]
MSDSPKYRPTSLIPWGSPSGEKPLGIVKAGKRAEETIPFEVSIPNLATTPDNLKDISDRFALCQVEKTLNQAQ